jgi:hypothetical protein
MATTTDLLKDVCANFLDAYGQNPQASSENIIAFEEMGIIPGLTTGSPNSAAVAVEFASTLADALPDISSGVYIRTARSLSMNYDNMLEGSVPCSQTQAATFNATKASARQAYDNSSLGSENGPTTFEPAFAMPVNWYDATQQTNWSHYSYSSSPPAATPPAAPPAGTSGSTPRPPLRIMTPIAPWRLTAAQPPAAVINRAPMEMAVARPLAESVTLARPSAPVTTPIERLPIGARLPIFVLPTRPADPAASQAPAPQPALQPDFTMSFDYCVVQLTRPWLSGDFLATPGWYVPGMTEGSYSSGPEPVVSALAGSTPAQAGTSSPATQQQPATYGPLTFIPTAFVAIKNLVMNASAIDAGATSTGPVSAFGPFSLVNATGAANALTAPGIQVIGWICEAQPQLPPATDPALIPVPSSSASTAVLSGTSAS